MTVSSGIFLIEVLQSLEFSQKWHSLIFICISTTSFSIFLNGSPCQKICPQQGLRQRDALCPNRFISCVGGFSWLLNKEQEEKDLHGIQITSFLFFIDDSLIFVVGILFNMLISFKECLIFTNLFMVNLSIWINKNSLSVEMYMMIIKFCSKVWHKLRLLSVIEWIWGYLLVLVGVSNLFIILSKIECGRS